MRPDGPPPAARPPRAELLASAETLAADDFVYYRTRRGVRARRMLVPFAVERRDYRARGAPGDYLVLDRDGDVSVCPGSVFAELYATEEVEDA